MHVCSCKCEHVYLFVCVHMHKRNVIAETEAVSKQIKNLFKNSLVRLGPNNIVYKVEEMAVSYNEGTH